MTVKRGLTQGMASRPESEVWRAPHACRTRNRYSIAERAPSGSYQEQTGRQLAAACGELSQLGGFLFADPVFG
jgi:hypothetical protein